MLKVYDSCNHGTAIRFIDDVLRRLPFRVLVVQTDNGAEFQSRFTGFDTGFAFICCPLIPASLSFVLSARSPLPRLPSQVNATSLAR